MTSHVFEATPDDAFGQFFGGADVPDQAAGGNERGIDEFSEREFGFAKAAASDQDSEALGAVEDLELTGVETELEF